MRGCGRSLHPLIYPFLLIACGFFGALIMFSLLGCRVQIPPIITPDIAWCIIQAVYGIQYSVLRHETRHFHITSRLRSDSRRQRQEPLRSSQVA